MTILERAARYAREKALRAVYHRQSQFTLLNEDAFVGNLRLVTNWTRDHDLSRGCVVECGTWRGGMLFGLLECCPDIEEFHAFDSFAGLPPAGDLDGSLARSLQESGAIAADNNLARLEEFMAGLERFPRAIAGKVQVHKGWFDHTLPGFRAQRPIAILRLDCDWYDSVTAALDALFDQVMSDGLIIIDDYLHWDGCSRAVHDFLSRRKARERIQQARSGCVFYMVKDYPRLAPAGGGVGAEDRI